MEKLFWCHWFWPIKQDETPKKSSKSVEVPVAQWSACHVLAWVTRVRASILQWKNCFDFIGFDQLKKTKLQKKAVRVWKCQWLSGVSTSSMIGGIPVQIRPGHRSTVAVGVVTRSRLKQSPGHERRQDTKGGDISSRPPRGLSGRWPGVVIHLVDLYKKYPGFRLSRQFSCSGFWITHYYSTTTTSSSSSSFFTPSPQFPKLWLGFEPAISDPWGRAHTTEPQSFSRFVLELIFHPSTCTRTTLSTQVKPKSGYDRTRFPVGWLSIRIKIRGMDASFTHTSESLSQASWFNRFSSPILMDLGGFSASLRETVIQIQTDH